MRILFYWFMHFGSAFYGLYRIHTTVIKFYCIGFEKFNLSKWKNTNKFYIYGFKYINSIKSIQYGRKPIYFMKCYPDYEYNCLSVSRTTWAHSVISLKFTVCTSSWRIERFLTKWTRHVPFIWRRRKHLARHNVDPNTIEYHSRNADRNGCLKKYAISSTHWTCDITREPGKSWKTNVPLLLRTYVDKQFR